MPNRNTATRSASTTSRSSAKNQAIQMLKADHKKVKKAFKDFEKLDAQEDAEECQALIEQTCSELEVHAELEEQVFYPAARNASKEEDLIDEAEVEHMSAKVLIQQLKEMNSGDEKYAATFKVLGEYIKHHITEEEGEMFKGLTRAGVDWDAVFEQMQTQRAQLLEEKGLPPEGAQADGGERARSAAGSARSSTRSSGEARPQAASRSSKSSSEKS
jgi:hemerythrin superfamily protein